MSKDSDHTFTIESGWFGPNRVAGSVSLFLHDSGLPVERAAKYTSTPALLTSVTVQSVEHS